MSMIMIRRADVSHLETVFDLVKGLAKYENAEDQVKANLKDYQDAFNSKLISIDIAVANETIVGCTIYYDTFSTWRGRMLYLEDFFVLDNYRRKGVGKRLFDAFISESKKRKCAMVKWQVLDWNEPAIKFYEKEGATIEKGWWNVKMIY